MMYPLIYKIVFFFQTEVQGLSKRVSELEEERKATLEYMGMSSEVSIVWKYR